MKWSKPIINVPNLDGDGEYTATAIPCQVAGCRIACCSN